MARVGVVAGSELDSVGVDTAVERPGAAPAEAHTPADGDTEFPLDFEEWRLSKPAPYRILLAGFKHVLRTKGGLLKKQTRKEWAAAFDAYCGEVR